MSDGIQHEAFDRQPFGFSWSNPRPRNLSGWDGPRDPTPEEEAMYERQELRRMERESRGVER